MENERGKENAATFTKLHSIGILSDTCNNWKGLKELFLDRAYRAVIELEGDGGEISGG